MKVTFEVVGRPDVVPGGIRKEHKMNEETNEEMRDAVEDLSLQLSNLWDDLDLLDMVRSIHGRICKDGVPSVPAFRETASLLRDTIERVRDWCDMSESALDDVESVEG